MFNRKKTPIADNDIPPNEKEYNRLTAHWNELDKPIYYAISTDRMSALIKFASWLCKEHGYTPCGNFSHDRNYYYSQALFRAPEKKVYLTEPSP